MTLNDIIVAALTELDRSHDAQTLDIWRSKFTRYVNDCIQDLALYTKPEAVEKAQLTAGMLDANALEHGCLRVMSIEQNGKALPFTTHGFGMYLAAALNPDGEVAVRYRMAPPTVSSPTDEPMLPAEWHQLIVYYVVGRERAAGDASTQRGGNIYFQMYQDGKKQLSLPRGTNDRVFLNRW